MNFSHKNLLQIAQQQKFPRLVNFTHYFLYFLDQRLQSQLYSCTLVFNSLYHSSVSLKISRRKFQSKQELCLYWDLHLHTLKWLIVENSTIHLYSSEFNPDISYKQPESGYLCLDSTLDSSVGIAVSTIGSLQYSKIYHMFYYLAVMSSIDNCRYYLIAYVKYTCQVRNTHDQFSEFHNEIARENCDEWTISSQGAQHLQKRSSPVPMLPTITIQQVSRAYNRCQQTSYLLSMSTRLYHLSWKYVVNRYHTLY